MLPAALASAPLQELVLDCARGDLPANVGLMRIFMVAKNAAEAERALAAALEFVERGGAQHAAARLRAILELWRQNPQAYDLVSSLLAIEQQGLNGANWESVFDRAAEISPEAGVALYSLGSAALLEEASEEIIERMRSWNLLGQDRTIVEIGCGIGRCVDKLAREARLAVGVEIAPKMLKLARARCAGSERAMLVRSSGRDLAAFRDGSFDVVLAVDSFPYLMRTGAELAAHHVREAARVLKPGGSLLILNFSYRGDPELDRADLAHLAAANQLEICRNGTREFALWDGLAFLLRRTSGARPNCAERAGNCGSTGELAQRGGFP